MRLSSYNRKTPMELEREELEFRDSMYRPEEIRFKRRNEGIFL